MTIILRRRKLGRTSCNEIAKMSETGILAYRNDQRIPDGHDLFIRWGTTSNLPYKAKVLNEASAIHWVADKANSRKLMADAGLSPRTWLSLEDFYAGPTKVHSGVIVRPSVHAQGRHVYHCTNTPELEAAWHDVGYNGYISEYVDKKWEFRVFVGSGRAVWVANKTPADPSAIAWNVAQGGRFDNVRWGEWNLEAVRVAIEAFNMSGLDFGGVDVMVDEEGRAYVLEINSAPSQTSPYRQSCVAKYFDYVVRNGSDHIPVSEGDGYKNYIHPAVCDGAIVDVYQAA